MLLDLGRLISLALSILSLYALMDSAFFVLATTWEQRLILSISRIGLAACVCSAAVAFSPLYKSGSATDADSSCADGSLGAVRCGGFVCDHLVAGCVLRAVSVAKSTALALTRILLNARLLGNGCRGRMENDGDDHGAGDGIPIVSCRRKTPLFECA